MKNQFSPGRYLLNLFGDAGCQISAGSEPDLDFDSLVLLERKKIAAILRESLGQSASDPHQCLDSQKSSIRSR